MNEYKKNIWANTVLMAMLLTSIIFALKYVFNPILLTHQESIAEDFQLENLQTLRNSSDINQFLSKDFFSYIKVTNNKLPAPVVVENHTINLMNYILPLPHSTIISHDGNQRIEYSAFNKTYAFLFEQILLLIIAAFVITILVMHLSYSRLIKRLELGLIREIDETDPPQSPLLSISKSIRKQKSTFHRALHKQEKQIEKLSHQVKTDTLTGFHNRFAFRQRLTELLNAEGETQHAVLFIIRASELVSINSTRGFQQGDEYINNIANILSGICDEFDHINIYRVSGSDLAILASDMNVSEAKRIASKLKVQFDQYQLLHNLDSVAYNGMSVIVSGQLVDQVLARTDMALALAQAEGANGWAFQQANGNGNENGQHQWQTIIEGIIEKRAVMLLHQPIQAIHRNMKGYQQVFTRFMGENNTMIPTDTVFAMAQRVDRIIKLEQLIIETLVSQCRHKLDSNIRFGVNLTSTAIQDSRFIVWLERLLLREPRIASCLIFEMREQILDINLVASKRIFDMFKRTGTRAAICNFGKGIGSFRLFKELKPDYIKIDASLMNNIERDSTNQQFVRMIIDVSHRMDCYVIAEGVEHLEQKQILENMYIDGVQGFLIARPSPL